MKIAMIVAMDEDGFIGKGNGLPWKIPTDMARFKELTIGDGFNSVVMGRKTWDSLPDSFRPLPERVNIVMSRDTSWNEEGAETALYIGRAIELAFAEGSDELWVIGGAEIYSMFLDRVDEIHVTTVHTSDSGEVSFPEWDKDAWVTSVSDGKRNGTNDEFATTYTVWKRV
ncbi:MAG: diacylglycerol kinase [Euryarchaeota archaeon]|nr:diacylglycerol kinase [Euryarchaeota archaeon]|tara:strand:+ start:31906 stop:32415 length:510 start_codon:yes stop_codon:yes gene_type:complete